ncbi:MAG: peptidoglycan DD-metalloendopeptidase family protein [Actinomycetota bacterium]
MSGRTIRRRLPIAIVLAILASAFSGTAASAVSRSQVERACSSSRAAYDEYQAASAVFGEAAEAYEAASLAVDNVLYRQERTADTIEIRREAMAGAVARFEEKAVEAYMSGGTSGTALFLGAGSLDRVITTNEFLTASASDERDAAGELAALQGELVILAGQLTGLENDLRTVEQERLEARDQQETAMLADQAAWQKLSGRCKELQKQFEIEQVRAAAARGGAAAGVPAAATPNFLCPFPGSSFINSWGAPRSGGRRHRGTDLMGAYGAPLYAVASGTVSIGSGGIGGKSVWLVADYGTGFYYAHLSGLNVGSGARVSRGDVIGYNGDTGNASGGAPHLHFEIHPGGRGSAAVNPYPTLVAACR